MYIEKYKCTYTGMFMLETKRIKLTTTLSSQIYSFLEREGYERSMRFSDLLDVILIERYKNHENRFPKIPQLPNEKSIAKKSSKKK